MREDLSVALGVQVTGRALSRQELIRRRRRTGLVGRQGEQAAFRDALQQSPEEAEQFLFHIHGPAGVGKSTLLRHFESLARETQSLTAYVDESAADAVEAMEAISSQLARQGAELKNFDKLLTTYRQRRHEVDASTGSVAAPTGSGASNQANEHQGPPPSLVIASQLALTGLGMIPGVGAFTSPLNASQIATSADRAKALLSARLRSHEDVELVLSPLQVLTPVFLRGLQEAAGRRPWVVLFFDTYERTGPMLDVWLRDILVTDRFGQLPANVLVVIAGQSRLDPQCWGDWLDLVNDLPLDVFTDAEARQLLAAKGITDEKVIEVILELSERLPVLVSTLAERHPSSVAEVGDPSGTAVERFLKWEPNPVRRAAALVCALPQELDEDTYRTVVDDEAREEFDWLRSMPFFINRAGRGHYHDVVRSAMLRLQRQQSPARWKEQHTRLAEAFRERRTQLESGATPTDSWWEDELWRSYRLQETYHRLCADDRTALPDALRELLDALDHDITTLRRWVQTLVRAGHDADASAVRKWGQDLLAALEGPRPGVSALTLLLSRGGLDTPGKCLAYALRNWEHRRLQNHEQALADCDAALKLEPTARAFRYRGETLRLIGRHEEALADYTRAIELDPGIAWVFVSRGETYLHMDRDEEALADYAQAIELDSEDPWAIASRGEAYRLMGRYEEALADCDRAIQINPENPWAIASRGETFRFMGRYEEALADFDRAIQINPKYYWALASRGETFRLMGRYEEALANFDRAIQINPEHHWALASRGQTYHSMHRYEEALADLSRAIELDRDVEWVLDSRGQTYHSMHRYEEALADYTHAIQINPEYRWSITKRSLTYNATGQHEEALADLTRAIEIDPSVGRSFADRGYLLRLIGRYEEALADFNRAIELDPSPYNITNRGVTYRVLGRYEEALADFNRAIELDPGNGWTHYENTVALYALRDPLWQTSALHTIKLCSLSPGEISNSIADIGNLFLVHCLMSQWTEAQRHLCTFLDSSPEREDLTQLLAVMNTLREVVPSAEEHLPSFHEQLEAALGA